MSKREKIDLMADLLDNEFIPALAFAIIIELSDII